MLALLIPGIGMGGLGVAGPGFVEDLPGDFNGILIQPIEGKDRGECQARKRTKPASPPDRGQTTGGRRNRFGGESHR